MTKDKKFDIISGTLTVVFFGLLIYGAYSLWYIFCGTDSGSDVHLYTVLCGTSIGWFVYYFIRTITINGGWIKAIISLFLGNAVFQGLIWGINNKINIACTDNEAVLIKTFTVTFSIALVCLFVSFVLKAAKHRLYNMFFALIYFALSLACLYNFNAENIRGLEYKKNIKFNTITAEEIALTENEKDLAEKWYNDNFIDNNGVYPFSFKVDGISFNSLNWEKCIVNTADDELYNGAKTEYIILTNDETSLEVTIELTYFENNATCQWMVFIKNTGASNSGVISEFYAYNSAENTGKAELYYSMGSNTAASDFSLIRKKLSSFTKSFSGVDGKPTENYLPYFNLNGENVGLIIGIGWTGQWKATFTLKKEQTEITVKQEHFEAYLLPDEEIRSPLVSVGFYDNANPLKGFNMFRSWIMDCVYPENVTKNQYTVMEIAGPLSTRTSDEIIEILNTIDESVYNGTDAFWMDAGWYRYTDGWHDGVGNWIVDTSRYDNGIIELSDYAKEKGLGHVLWYEPERVAYGTEFHKIGSEHEEWLITGEDNIMWNLANEEAFVYYSEYLLASLTENGVTVYRQDFNFAPLEYWHKADIEFYDGRVGICENHYVTNLYRFLDYLTENIDGLIIDNCASGGKRLDLEMTYRSIPFWRSDYNCSYHSDLFNATQSHTYGISFWLPISGSALYMQDEYAMRSDIMPLMLMDFFSNTHSDFGFYKEQRELMSERYFPLDFGSYDDRKILAMQYTDSQAGSGQVLIYKRQNVTATEYNAVLNGLDPRTVYEIYDYDNPQTVYTLTGEQLMNEGFTVSLPDGPKAVILMFAAV